MTMKKKVAILHPDLGIGGAENLIINVALALKMKNYDVKIYTPYYDPKRCFEECKLLDIEVKGNWFPRTIFGRFIAFCAYIRMLLCALWVVFFA
jgi:alpha-1,3/alpha-1,6-mannosyltransferase